MIKKILLVALSVLMISSMAYADKKVGGVKLPESLKAGAESVDLNGAGIRKKFGVAKIYVGALYLKQKSSSANKIIEADEPMVIRMQWLRELTGAETVTKITDAWTEGFKLATENNNAPIQAKIDQFNTYFKDGMMKNDYHDVVYVPGEGTSVYKNGELLGKIDGIDFKKAVFGIWLCDGVSEKALVKLKKGMLGK